MRKHYNFGVKPIEMLQKSKSIHVLLMKLLQMVGCRLTYFRTYFQTSYKAASIYKSFVRIWQIRYQGQRKGFCKLLKEILMEDAPNIIISGFRKCEIFPFNPKVMSKEHSDPLSFKRWEAHQKKMIEEVNAIKNILLPLK